MFSFKWDFALVFSNDPREHFGTSSVGYSYRILEPEGREILAYHWHPTSVSPVKNPHVHLSSRIGPLVIAPSGAAVALADMHLPTGFVDLNDVVRLLIAEFGVEPRRADWDAVLAGAAFDPWPNRDQ